ncbi:MAG: polymer-forming cytoskeletal protein [Treponema sp.]|nr:polymer-forming cytoskeletal protein [Treponema sp.]MBQ2552237.1 polymer-forming cytoskeletal protein [Treponema sp.]MBQ4235766.1 polymer-forming cytoskeletal protein [Treponema sp.]MBQ5383118.1 polymer-forming cytoskeletal protein [Treponema sp.]
MANELLNMTVFGQETEFDGVLNFTDNLVITGRFNGTIDATGALEIDRTAVCICDKMSARSIVVYGMVTGDLEATERVELCRGSKVKGDIRTTNLRIADNVEFEGQVSMIDNMPDVNIFSVASVEYKNAIVMKNPDADL